jgi:hypothetical protein
MGSASGILPAFNSDGSVLHFKSAGHAVKGVVCIESKETRMHASMAYVNGAGEKRRSRGSRKLVDNLALLNTLLAAPSAESPAVDQRKPKNERQAEEENKSDSVSKPGGFANDPDDPKNPNEARERHQRKVRP